jgi:hypothetical protein
MPSPIRSCFSILAAGLLLSQPLFAFDAHLSDEAIRNAYFLGQRHDGTLHKLLDKYTRRLPLPKSGPYISSVVFLTPFIQVVEYSDSFIGNFSAQQALAAHRSHDEFAEVFVNVQLTDSYRPLIVPPATRRSRSATPLISRPYDFWRDFQVQIFDGDKLVVPVEVHGHPSYICGESNDCSLTGATIELDFPADAFISDTATVFVTPPQGDPVSVDFDLLSFR